MIRIGITGTRQGMTYAQMNTVRGILESKYTAGSTFRHGDCKGVDAMAHNMARDVGYFICVHPPIIGRNRAFCQGDEIRPPKDYLLRNMDIVDESDMMIAAPKSITEEFRGSGTWHAIRYCRRMRRHLYLVWPDGTTTEEFA